MTAIFANAPLTTFDGLAFPFTSRSAKLEFRHHVHEFPKMAGGDPEKLGRKLWVFTYEIPAHEGMRAYPGFFSKTLPLLIEKAATGYTAPLIDPTLGEIRCFITSADLKRQGKIMSGEEVTFSFIEDDLEPARDRRPLTTTTLAAQTTVLSSFVLVGTDDPVYLTEIEKYREPMGSFLDCLRTFLALRDQLDLYGQRAQSQLVQVESLARQVHDILTPASLDPVRQTLRAIWDTAHTLRTQAKDTGKSVLIPFVVPQAMAVGAIAQLLYGSSARGGEVLAINTAITDPFAVRAGTTLHVPAP